MKDAKIFPNTRSFLCKHLGHRWKYKDYSNYIKENGDSYDFSAARNCTRCNQFAYFYDKWENQEKSEHDFENHNSYMDEIEINSVVYT